MTHMLRCDRCKGSREFTRNEYPVQKGWKKLNFVDKLGDINCDEGFDICPECIQAVSEFLTGKQETEADTWATPRMS